MKFKQVTFKKDDIYVSAFPELDLVVTHADKNTAKKLAKERAAKIAKTTTVKPRNLTAEDMVNITNQLLDK